MVKPANINEEIPLNPDTVIPEVEASPNWKWYFVWLLALCVVYVSYSVGFRRGYTDGYENSISRCKNAMYKEAVAHNAGRFVGGNLEDADGLPRTYFMWNDEIPDFMPKLDE